MRRKCRKNVRGNIRNWIFFFIKPLSIIIIIIIIIDHPSLSSSVVLSVPRFAWRTNRRVSFHPVRRIPGKKAFASRESAIYHSNSFVPCSLAGSMYLLVSACSFFCRYSTQSNSAQLIRSTQESLSNFLSADNAPPTIKITFPCV